MTKPSRKRRRAYFDDSKLMAVIKIVNKHCQERIKTRLIVDNCEELDSPSIWYVHFDATDYEWLLITRDLTSLGNITIIEGADLDVN